MVWNNDAFSESEGWSRPESQTKEMPAAAAAGSTALAALQAELSAARQQLEQRSQAAQRLEQEVHRLQGQVSRPGQASFATLPSGRQPGSHLYVQPGLRPLRGMHSTDAARGRCMQHRGLALSFASIIGQRTLSNALRRMAPWKRPRWSCPSACRPASRRRSS